MAHQLGDLLQLGFALGIDRGSRFTEGQPAGTADIPQPFQQQVTLLAVDFEGQGVAHGLGCGRAEKKGTIPIPGGWGRSTLDCHAPNSVRSPS